MEFHAIYRAFRKRFWLVALCCLVGVGVAYFVGRGQTPVYSTTTTLALNPGAAGGLLPYQTSGNTEIIAANYTQFMRTRSFSSLVAGAIEPPVSPGEVLEAFSVQFVTGTQFFRITATSVSPRLAQQIANTTARVFIQENAARQRARQDQIEKQRSQAIASVMGEGRYSTQQMLADQIRRNKEQVLNLQQRLVELQATPASDARTREVATIRQQLYELENLNMQAMTALTAAESSRIYAGELSGMDIAVVIDEAPLPTRPSAANTTRNLLFAFAGSLIVGLSGVFLLEYLDYTFKTAEELEQAFGLPTLGLVHDATKSLPKGTSLSHSLSAAPQSPFSEAIRTLRTNVQFAAVGRPLRSILVTSTVPFEGKSTIASNLAVAFAQAGKRVVLVDADLRRPSIHHLFGRLNDCGLTTLVIDPERDPATCLKDTDVPNLQLLLAGPVPPNPSEILATPRTENVLAALAQHADLVVIDSPPSIVVSDAPILAAKVDGVLQVVLAGRTRREVVLKGKERLTRAGAHILGTVLNRAQVADSPYGQSYYNSYYSTGSGRGAKTDAR